MNYKYLWMAAFVLPFMMFTACGSDGEEGEIIDPDKKTDPTTAAIVNDTQALSYVDESYRPAVEEIQGKDWVGEYTGWDENQQANTNIRRLLKLKANGTYTNVIQGKLIGSGKEDRWADFEHEAGTYSYNASSKTVTYIVRTDSVLHWETQKMKGYTKKKYFDREEGSYTETARFSTLKDGSRSWITQDMYLQSLTDKTINIYFMMIVNVDKK